MYDAYSMVWEVTPVFETEDMENITLLGLPMTEKQLKHALARPQSVSQVQCLAENREQFEFIPKVKTPEAYGRYMIWATRRFEYDDNSEGFSDFEGYARQRMIREQGQFVESGYISYYGFLSPDEVVTVYRWATSYHAKNVNSLSWTLNRDTAEWFAHRFDEHGTVCGAQIPKEHIYAVFLGRNAAEVIVDPKRLQDITPIQEQSEEFQMKGFEI